MSSIWLIATNTLRESVRKRLFLNVLIFGIGMVLFAMVASNLTIGVPARVVRSIGLSGTSVALNLLTMLLGVGLIHSEIDKQTLFVVLTRPVDRWQYVSGRYLGLAMSSALVAVGFTLAHIVVLVALGEPNWRDFLALGASWVEAVVLGGFALVLSAFSTPSLSAGVCLGFWVVCTASDDLVGLTRKAEPTTRILAEAVHYLLPAFSRFNFREVAIYGDGIDPWALAHVSGYGLGYVVLFTILASLILQRRDMV